ncbi:MAG TPA: class I SAM-dependent methyltransferase, partial [Rhizomicrobium sp.]|nr:class I SAM-dependent methyltransferase [Rhizomicrobium sp.]
FPAVVRAAMKDRVGVPRILEVGSWAGGSLIAWWRAAGAQALLTAVDAWEPYLPAGSRWPHYDEMSEAARSGGIEALFRHNVAAAGIPEARLTVRKGDSRRILPTLPSFSFDVAFIDGDHRYRIVKEDIAACVKLVRVGGILCGDDLDQQLSEINAEEHREIMDIDEEVATTRSGLCYHHGVVQAVHDSFGPVLCLEKRLWIVRKTPSGWESTPSIY